MEQTTNMEKDMAICFVVFNPAKSKRLLMNYLYVLNKFNVEGLPTFTIEIVYKGRQPEIPNAYHVESNSIMFHKENLYRVLEKKIPNEYKKLALLDCDILFEDTQWYYKVSALLNEYDVVQPFETANWMDLSYSKPILSRKTALLMEQETWDQNYHPGFAWCMRRDWYNKVGFFDYAITGSGDILSCSAWLNKWFKVESRSFPKCIFDELNNYKQLPRPKITYLKNTVIQHLYHGSFKDRQYANRHKMLDTNKNIQDLIVQNNDGLFEWKIPEQWNPVFLNYFVSRKEDDLSTNVSKTVQAFPRINQSLQRTIQPGQRTMAPIQRTIQPGQRTMAPIQRTIQPVQRTMTPIQRTIQPVQRTTTLIQGTMPPIQTLKPNTDVSLPG